MPKTTQVDNKPLTHLDFLEGQPVAQHLVHSGDHPLQDELVARRHRRGRVLVVAGLGVLFAPAQREWQRLFPIVEVLPELVVLDGTLDVAAEALGVLAEEDVATLEYRCGRNKVVGLLARVERVRQYVGQAQRATTLRRRLRENATHRGAHFRLGQQLLGLRQLFVRQRLRREDPRQEQLGASLFAVSRQRPGRYNVVELVAGRWLHPPL